MPRAAASALEIGPFCSPVLTGPNVKYLDVLTPEGLRARAAEIGLDATNCPERIDYLGDLGDVTDSFDAVFSSHAIEHQPDLVRHLNEVAAVLKPGGRYYLLVPDKRFCFDHFMAESTVAQVVDAHEVRRRVHSLMSVIENHAFATHNNSEMHWMGDHGTPFGPDEAYRVTAGMDRHAAAAGDYIDVHAWYFTPASFAVIIETLFRLNLTKLRPAVVYETPRNRLEFSAVLEVA
ncbi:class I SAM-dependent methyltransferase [Sphingomonas solaris]|uniref:Class I SAM-dependent methyltransferase n=2 Tax=Alterirhizorhabdus solaris TaxID=2529389 RepID=A0A558QXR8_9SPHN|nr:class I SAM-dependent methyltransferase [Sphingomonas solaris]